MDDAAEELEAYVRAALSLQGYRFDEARTLEILRQFTRIESIARSLAPVPLAFDASGAAVYRP